MALGRGAALLLENHVLSATLGRSVLTDLLRTPHFAAGAALVVLALALGVTAVWLRAGHATSSAGRSPASWLR